MSTDTTYNGWSTYATWRINLEIIDDYDWSRDRVAGLDQLAEVIADMTHDAITNYGEITSGLAYDYAMAFIDRVDWHEIAEAVASNYPTLLPPEDDDEDIPA